jgi:CHRD domain/PEP-CTERM motif
MKRLLTLLAAGAVALVATPALAVVTVYQAALSGPAEGPPNASPGTGIAEVTYNTVAHSLHVHVSFSGLTGTTTASHIHAPSLSNVLPDPPNPTFGVATTTPTFAGFPLGVTSGAYDNTLDLTLASSWNPSYITANGGTTATAEAQLALTLSQTRTYLNIHTSTFGGGEIRGFLTRVVPEPGTLGVAAVAMLALTAARRRK